MSIYFLGKKDDFMGMGFVISNKYEDAPIHFHPRLIDAVFNLNSSFKRDILYCII